MSNYIWFAVAFVFGGAIAFAAAKHKEKRKSDKEYTLEAMKESIRWYLCREFGDNDGLENFSDLKEVPLGYTTDGNHEHSYEFYADLVEPSIYYKIDGNVCWKQEYSDLNEMLKVYGLQGEGFDFEDMTGTCDWIVEDAKSEENT